MTKIIRQQQLDEYRNGTKRPITLAKGAGK
jgi:hypothetical protein